MESQTLPDAPPAAEPDEDDVAEQPSGGSTVWSPVAVSFVVHGLAMVVLWMVTFAAIEERPQLLIETVIADEKRETEEFVKELDTQKEVATAINFVAGSISTSVGGTNSPMAKQDKIEFEEVVTDQVIAVNPGIADLVGVDSLANDLGEAEVTGDVGAVVEGYGAALDRLTQELIRLMRSQQLLVVWMFDESGSMKDDQQEIRDRLHRVYEELKLANDTADPTTKRTGGAPGKLSDALLTSINSFGGEFHPQMQQPSSDVTELMAAIDRIKDDPTGAENTCAAIIKAIGMYRPLAQRAKRKLVMIVVSDESGDDGEYVEDALQAAKSSKTPIYILGREAVFGSLYAHVRWQDPVTKHVHLLPIRRGPETPFAELLQYDGYRHRTDSQMSGFGPYEQVRLVRDTGGIFFQLPHEQQNLNDFQDYKFDMLDLREYLPSLESRRVYETERNASPFRKALWECIGLLNPYDKNNAWLEVRTHGSYHIDPAKSTPNVTKDLQKLTVTLQGLHSAQSLLESVRSLRDKEPSLRWRANYDLMAAQLFAYKVRLFQFAIALDHYNKTIGERKFKSPKTNHWSVGHGGDTLIMPDEQQAKFLNVSPEQLQDAHKKAKEQLQAVVVNHPKTPWARRATWELSRKFGVYFAEHYWVPPPPPDPSKPRPPAPKPTPIPKL